MKITKIIVAALVMLTTTASVNAEVTEVTAPAEVTYVQLPPPPPHPPRPRITVRRPVAHRRVVHRRRRPVITLPHIKLPRHPGPPPAPPRP
jgi:hypothetical protein